MTSLHRWVAAYRGHTVPHFDLVGHKKWWFALSGFFIALSIFGLAFRGLHFSIEFTGGSQLTYPDPNGASVGSVQAVLAKYGRAGDSEVEIVNGNSINITTASLTELGTRADALRAELAKLSGINPDAINEQDVGPSWGAAISAKAIQGLIIFLILVTLYISFRFEWKMAVSALIALLHDLIIVTGIYALVGREVTPESVIAILTILGYSLYDTVVIFDKIKENTDSASLVTRETYGGVVNMSLNQTLMRSVNTSLVVLLPIGALLLFGGQTLKDFAFALFVGIASGTYSSIFIASQILTVLKEREPRYQQIRSRAAVREARSARVEAVPATRDGADGEARELEPASVSSAPTQASRNGGGQRPRGTSSGQRRRKGGSGSRGKPKRRRR